MYEIVTLEPAGDAPLDRRLGVRPRPAPPGGDAHLLQTPTTLPDAVPPDRRDTLLAERSDDGYRFDIRLQGDGETVFFDV